MTLLTGLIKGATDSIGSITPVANIAALRALTSAPSANPDSPIFVYVAGHTTAGDGGEGFFALSPGSNLPDDDGLVVVSASAGTFVRQWDKLNCFPAWWGFTPASSDTGPLFAKIPFYTYTHFGPGIYTFLTYPTQAAFSAKFYRGSSTIWNCVGTIGTGTAFTLTDVAFDWVWVATQTVQNLPFGSDSAQAGLSPIEGVGIISQLGVNFGVGLKLGGSIAAQPAGGIRATTSTATGKVQFEVLCGANTLIGFSTSAFSLTGNLGEVVNALLVLNQGSIFSNGNAAVNGLDGYVAGNVMTIAIDFTAQLIWTRNSTTNPTKWNNSGTANPATGTGGISFAFMAGATQYFATLTNNPGDTTTVNFGATPFVTALPAGFSAYGAATTLNPADNAGETLSSGNLTATFAGSGGALPGTNPVGYFTRPKNFTILGFYCGVDASAPDNYFLTGLENVILKSNSIGLKYDQTGAANSGENMMFTDCDFDNCTVDGVQSLGAVKTTFRGCSFDYCLRYGFFSNNYTFFENCYFETQLPPNGPTTAELFACDTAAILDFLPGTSFLSTGGPTQGYPPGNLINFESSTGIAYFRGNPFCDANITRQFLQPSAGQNIYGSNMIGFNGRSFPMCLSPNNLLQNDSLFASGTTFYPGSTCTFAGSSAVFTGAQTLHFETMACQPGDLIAVSFLDTLSGTITALGGSLVFSTGGASPVTVATQNFSTSPGVAGFTFGSSPGSTLWNTTARGSTIQQFVFRVPPGASNFTGTLTTTGGSGTYSLTSLAIYKGGT